MCLETLCVGAPIPDSVLQPRDHTDSCAELCFLLNAGLSLSHCSKTMQPGGFCFVVPCILLVLSWYCHTLLSCLS